jgi:hypothetical protein
MKYTRVDSMRKRLREKMVFRTYDDLLHMYHQRQDVVDDLVARKTRIGAYRPHPEFANRSDMTQYWVCGDTEASSDREQLESLATEFLLTDCAAGDMKALFGREMTPPGLHGTASAAAAMPSPASTEVVAGTTPKQRKPARPVKPDSPLKKGQLLLKCLNKTVIDTRSKIMNLSMYKSQSELVGKLDAFAKQCEQLFQGVQRLVNEKHDTEAGYLEFLNNYKHAKESTQSYLDEVCAHSSSTHLA